MTQMGVTKSTILSMATLTTSKSTALRNHSNAAIAPCIVIVRLYFKSMSKFIWLLKSHMYVKCVTEGSPKAVMLTSIRLHVSKIQTLSKGARSVNDYSQGGTNS